MRSEGGCVVCGSKLSLFFTKPFGGQWGLGEVDYWQCGNCGLTISKTLYDMSQEDWEALNEQYHGSLFELGREDPRRAMRLRGIERLHVQAKTIALLTHEGLIPRRLPWVDHGCGDGVLANALLEQGLPILKFDPYISDEGYLTADELGGPYSLVVSTAVFEHLRERAVLNEIAALVADDGVLALHVLVRESIPKDPDWFYLLPVHCTLFTNKSMQILFEQWGFAASLYHVPSRMWFWFQKCIDDDLLKGWGDEFYYKKAFADYWS